MSRRSVLLATTIYIAVGSLTAVGPASAHGFGFGGFGGGASFAYRSPAYAPIARAPIQSMGRFDAGRYGHAPSIGAPVAETGMSGARTQPLHLPAAANAPLGQAPAAAQVVHPERLPPTINSSGPGIQRPAMDAAGVIRPNGSLTQIKDISAAEAGAKLPKPGSSGGVPNVAGPDATIMGQGPTSNVPKIPDVKVPDGPNVNLPGTQFGRKGPREVPGFGDGAGGASHLNVPGTSDQHSPNDAGKKLSEMEQADKQLLNAATKGGPNSLNTSAGLTPGETQSDRFGAETGAAASAASFVNTGRPVQPIVNTGTPVNVWTSKGSDGNGGTVSVTNVSGPNTDRTTIVHTAKDGTTTTKTTSYDPKTSEIISSTTTTTPPGGDGKKNTPNDDSSNSHDIGGLSASSALGRKGQGGGTDNNGTESASGESTQLAPGAASGRTGNGDGKDGRRVDAAAQ